MFEMNIALAGSCRYFYRDISTCPDTNAANWLWQYSGRRLPWPEWTGEGTGRRQQDAGLRQDPLSERPGLEFRVNQSTGQYPGCPDRIPDNCAGIGPYGCRREGREHRLVTRVIANRQPRFDLPDGKKGAYSCGGCFMGLTAECVNLLMKKTI